MPARHGRCHRSYGTTTADRRISVNPELASLIDHVAGPHRASRNKYAERLLLLGLLADRGQPTPELDEIRTLVSPLELLPAQEAPMSA